MTNLFIERRSVFGGAGSFAFAVARLGVSVRKARHESRGDTLIQIKPRKKRLEAIGQPWDQPKRIFAGAFRLAFGCPFMSQRPSQKRR
jgi:hypothetical protein